MEALGSKADCMHASYAVVPGAPICGTSARPTATGPPLTTGTSSSAFGSGGRLRCRSFAFLHLGLPFVGALAAGIGIHGKPIWFWLSAMALYFPLRSLPSLSQRWRTVGVNCVPIMRIRQEVHRERVKVPLFSYISPLRGSLS